MICKIMNKERRIRAIPIVRYSYFRVARSIIQFLSALAIGVYLLDADAGIHLVGQFWIIVAAICSGFPIVEGMRYIRDNIGFHTDEHLISRFLPCSPFLYVLNAHESSVCFLSPQRSLVSVVFPPPPTPHIYKHTKILSRVLLYATMYAYRFTI